MSPKAIKPNKTCLFVMDGDGLPPLPPYWYEDRRRLLLLLPLVLRPASMPQWSGGRREGGREGGREDEFNERMG